MNRLLHACGGLILFLAVGACPAAGQDLFGYTEPVRIAQSAFAEAGILDEILVKEGDRVKAGQVLAKLDSRIFEHDLNVAREMARLQALRHQQMESLQKQNSISTEEFERSRSDLIIGEERVQRIVAQIDGRTLRAPFDGVVVRIFRERSENISPTSDEVMTIAKLDVLKVILHVPMDKAAVFREGGTVPVLLEGALKTDARVVFISPVIDAASRTVRIQLDIPNPDGAYRAGMRCVPQPAGVTP